LVEAFEVHRGQFYRSFTLFMKNLGIRWTFLAREFIVAVGEECKLGDLTLRVCL
jgi:hypothetical protein